jgi:subtilisin-like proprotein convertase family protein
MAAATYNFYIEQGSDFQITFQYLDNNSNPIDVSNYCARLRLKDSNNTIRLYSSSVGCGNYSLTTNAFGYIIWNLPASTTKDFNFDSAVYDLDIGLNGQSVQNTRISTGRIEIIKNNFPDCNSSSTDRSCANCGDISCEDSNGFSIGGSGTGSGVSPTGDNPTPTPTPTIISPCNIIQEDFCGYLCQGMDMFGKLYSGSGFNVPDVGFTSGTISIADTGIITNVEISIDKLTHNYPQDLSMILVPPSGQKILLSSHNKIKNYNSLNGLSFAFSNKALPSVYLNNRDNEDYYLNILDKRSSYNFTLDNINYESLDASITGLVGYSCSGDWSLIIKDEDIGSSGSISGWHIVLTYEPPPYEA